MSSSAVGGSFHPCCLLEMELWVQELKTTGSSRQQGMRESGGMQGWGGASLTVRVHN